MQIINFILIRYKRKKWDNMPPLIKEKYSCMNMEEWDNVQEDLYQQQIKQLNKIYHGCTIHVLTNDALRIDQNVIIHCFPELESNHVSKLKVYGLIDEPAMYLDNDIIINRRWNDDQLPMQNPINLYIQSKNYDIQALASKSLPIKITYHYNAGVIWIPKPSKQLSDTLFSIHEEYFSDKENIMSQGKWADSDELPVALYAAQNKITMKLDDTISVDRQILNEYNFKYQQSVHYTGVDIKVKKLCLKEYQMMNLKVH